MRLKWVLVLVGFVASLSVSCVQMGNVDYSQIQSVGLANGFDDSLMRSKVGTTAFNNKFEKVTVPGLSKSIVSTGRAVLKESVPRVEILDIPVSPSRYNPIRGGSRVIDSHKFSEDAVASAKAKGLDAVWIIYPTHYSDPYHRGAPLEGFEHRQNAMLGMKRDSVHLAGFAELVDTASGKTLRLKPTGILARKEIESEEWKDSWSNVTPSRRKVITDSLAEITDTTLRVILR